MKKTLSAIICTKDRLDAAILCVKTIYEQTRLPDELLVVDCSKLKQLEDELKQFLDKLKIKYIHTETPGLTRQRNIGIRESKGDYVLFLDDDTELDKDFLKEIIRAFEESGVENIGGVTGEVVLEEKQGSSKRKILNFLNNTYATLFQLPRYGNGKFSISGSSTTIKCNTVKDFTKVEFLCGCNMAFKRRVLQDFEFDEKLVGSTSGWIGEDDDVACYMKSRYQNIYTPFAKIKHNITPTARFNNYKHIKVMIENSHYLFKKNLPQGIKHKTAFWWAAAGFLLKEAISGVRRRDLSGVRGFLDGWKEIIRKRKVAV